MIIMIHILNLLSVSSKNGYKAKVEIDEQKKNGTVKRSQKKLILGKEITYLHFLESGSYTKAISLKGSMRIQEMNQ